MDKITKLATRLTEAAFGTESYKAVERILRAELEECRHFGGNLADEIIGKFAPECLPRKGNWFTGQSYGRWTEYGILKILVARMAKRIEELEQEAQP